MKKGDIVQCIKSYSLNDVDFYKNKIYIIAEYGHIVDNTENTCLINGIYFYFNKIETYYSPLFYNYFSNLKTERIKKLKKLKHVL